MNCQTSVTFGIDVAFFGPTLKSCSTDGQHAKKEPWSSEMDCKQAGTLNVVLVANCKTERDSWLLYAHGLRNELVRRFSGRKGVYRTISGLLEDPVHTRLIPANWLEFRKEGGSAACRGQRPRTGKSSMLRVVSAKRVWSNLDWLNSSLSGLLADASER